MKLTVFAMRHPITTLTLVVALLSGGTLALSRMRVDIFPSLNTPRIYVFLQYGGMSPSRWRALSSASSNCSSSTSTASRRSSRASIQQIALVELSFYPGPTWAQANGKVVAMANRAMSRMPPGTCRRWSCAWTPAASRSATSCWQARRRRWAWSPTRPEHHPAAGAGERPRHGRRLALRPERPLHPRQVRSRQTAGLQPLSAGCHQRPHDRQRRGPGRELVHQGLDAHGAQQRDRSSTSRTWARFRSTGQNVYIRDVATITDVTDLDYGYALVNGTKFGLSADHQEERPPRR